MTLEKIANLVGTSKTTISRVINNRPGVSEEQASRIRKVMREVGYVPSERRRGPKIKKNPDEITGTGTIVFLAIGRDSNDIRDLIPRDVLSGVMQEASDHKLKTMLIGLKNDEAVHKILNRQFIDGLLLTGEIPSKEMGRSLGELPVVWTQTMPLSVEYYGDCVHPNNEAVGRMAAEYLLKKECRKLAFLCADSSRYGMLAKGEAFYNAVEMAGMECRKLTGHSSSNISPLFTLEEERESVNLLIDQLLNLQPVPDGIFVPNDFITVLVYQALTKHGIMPGKDIIIVSCDNEPILDTLDPRPVSIDTRGEELGRRAVQQLCWRMEHFYDPNQITIGICPRIID